MNQAKVAVIVVVLHPSVQNDRYGHLNRRRSSRAATEPDAQNVARSVSTGDGIIAVDDPVAQKTTDIVFLLDVLASVRRAKHEA